MGIKFGPVKKFDLLIAKCVEYRKGYLNDRASKASRSNC